MRKGEDENMVETFGKRAIAHALMFVTTTGTLEDLIREKLSSDEAEATIADLRKNGEGDAYLHIPLKRINAERWLWLLWYFGRE